MSGLRVKDNNELSDERKPFNTTINEIIQNNFKISCQKTGIPMNVILEVFMVQFSNGEFNLKFTSASDMSFEIPE